MLDIKDIPVSPAITRATGVTALPSEVGSIAHTLQNAGSNIPTDAQAGSAIGKTWAWFSRHAIGQFYTDMLEIGLGVDTSQFDNLAAQGVKTVDTMLGFTFTLQYVVAAIETFGEGLLANRWGKALKETVGKIPEEMGLSWALGLTIDEAFKTAVGRSVEEGINRQKRGNRLAWQQIRVMLKQHVLHEREFEDLLKNQGYPDEQIAWLKQLVDVQLPVGDLQQMYLHGLLTRDEVRAYIHRLGYDPTDADNLYAMYIDKAETESSALLRSTARTLYTNNLIDETRYRQILQTVNYPALLIEDDIAAVNLLHETGRIQTSVANLKSMYLHNPQSWPTVEGELKDLNYTAQAITNLKATWDAAPLTKVHQLPLSKILSFLVSGVLTPEDAKTRIIMAGYDAATAQLLVDHPHSVPGVRQYHLTPGMITTAFVQGVIGQSELAGLYKQVGVTDDALNDYVKNALFRRSHYKQAPDHTNTLSDGEIRSAFKLGLMDETTALSRLEHNGWSSDDALLLLEITNKGPIRTAPKPSFATVGDAMDYLARIGFTIYAASDPRIFEAESMVQTAGYSVSPPSAGLPPPQVVEAPWSGTGGVRPPAPPQ